MDKDGGGGGMFAGVVGMWCICAGGGGCETEGYVGVGGIYGYVGKLVGAGGNWMLGGTWCILEAWELLMSCRREETSVSNACRAQSCWVR